MNNLINILIILIIIILILLLTSNNFSNFSNYGNSGNDNKCLIILYGEMFRDGNIRTRIRDNEIGYKTQKPGSLSQVRFFDYLRTKYNIKPDLIINTYNTIYESEVKDWFKDYLINYISYDDLIGQHNLVKNAIKSINNVNDYNFIIIMRIDIFLKDPFFDIFDPSWNQIKFINQIWLTDLGWSNCGFVRDDKYVIPGVNHTITFIPNTFFNVLDSSKVGTDHLNWKIFKNEKNIKDTEMGFMINTYHGANSYNDNNPFYYFVGREENQVHHDIGKVIDPTLFGEKKDNNNVNCKINYNFFNPNDKRILNNSE